MVPGPFVAYFRVSTTDRRRIEPALAAQRAAVKAYLSGGAFTLAGEFLDVEGGRGGKRPQLILALDLCRLTRATLIIAKLGGLSRSVAFTANLMGSAVDFIACDKPLATRLTIPTLAAAAAHEATQLIAGLAAAQARGVVLGGYHGAPTPDWHLGHAARSAKADEFAAQLKPIVEDMRARGLSLRRIVAELDHSEIVARRGGRWSAMAVKRVLARTSVATIKR